MVSLNGLYEKKTGVIDRACNVLRVSTKDALIVRLPDPLMIDWMLLHSGLGSEAKAIDFVKRYTASVFYDKNLELKDQAATRQCNLLDPAKISADRTALLRRRVNKSESFNASGMSLQIMIAIEFWAGSRLHSSTHPLWKALGSTTEESCTVACREYFDRCDKGYSGLSLFKKNANGPCCVTVWSRGLTRV